ncbi:MAG: twin-arginine translocase TatA/TatE family subunit [Bacteroidetes bacterium]|nr:twin-arginine translocase TatA/TatE family subunit [Bacteroidota bacterium]
MGNIGGQELFIILLIVLIFFGAKKLPELARGLGQGIREFRKAAKDVQDEVEKAATNHDHSNEQPSEEKK